MLYSIPIVGGYVCSSIGGGLLASFKNKIGTKSK